LALSRFSSITQPILAKTLNELVNVFESQGNLPQSEGLLAPPKRSKCLNTLTGSLKCGDMSGSTSTDNKSKNKDFVANEVNESNSESSEVTSQDIQPTKKQSKLQVFFFRSILQVEFNHVYSLCNI
jgi:hypothetical protein